ncbi:MAG: hypothetical protein JRJ04_11105 [Deltaproteobacteria bacterium]|nr:hypothetical protein [Deltaproteobacteria bacterium]
MAHYLEAAGVPTTQVSLIREHTETIRPPRALWVPFELGRPLGAPENPEIQRRVLMMALDLLEASEGPVLLDFPEEIAESLDKPGREPGVWACPVSFTPALKKETDLEKLISEFKREVATLRPWYDLWLEKRGRSAVGNFDPDTSSGLLGRYVLGDPGKPPEIPGMDLSLAVALRLAAQDLKAFYFEAAISRPGASLPESSKFNRWFWNETAAGRVLKTVKERCINEKDDALRITGAKLLIPLDQT